MEEKKAILGLVIASLIWAVSSLAYKFFLDEGLSFLVILWIMIFFRLVGVWIIADYKKVEHELVTDRWELKMLFLNGIFSIAYPILFIFALSEIGISDVYFLAYTAPAWVLLMAVFILGEKLNIKKVFGLILTLLGIYFITSPGGTFALSTGAIYALVGAVVYAASIVTGRELKDYSYHTVSIYSNAFQVIALTIMGVMFFEFPSLEFPVLFGLAIVLLGLLRGIASDLYYYALEKLEASSAAIISLSELIFASVLAFLFFGETHTLVEVMGYCLIILSGFIILLRKSDLEHFEYLLHLKRKH